MKINTKELDFFTKAQIQSSFEIIEKTLETGIFSPTNISSPFLRASFVHILIHLRDLMYKTEKHALKRINFTDDVTQLKTNKHKVEDVTDLIKFVRDAICHPETSHHFFDDGIRASFNIAYGKTTLMNINGIEVKSDYDDDVCFFFGKTKIHLNRHIIRACNEARIALMPLL